jgi:hypothetical protein
MKTGRIYSGRGVDVTPELPAIPQRGYYDAHPEERFMEMTEAQNKPYRDAYMQSLEHARQQSQGFNLPMDPRMARSVQAAGGSRYRRLTEGLPDAMARGSAIPAEYYKTGMEYSPNNPASQLSLAHANYFKSLAASAPALREAQINHFNAQAVKEGRQPLVHGIWGVFDPNEMKYYAAPNSGKNFKDMMTNITNSGKNAITPEQKISSTREQVKAWKNKLTEEEYEGLPEEWKAGKTVRLYRNGVGYDIPEDKVTSIRKEHPELKEKP